MQNWKAWVRRVAITAYVLAIPFCLLAAIGIAFVPRQSPTALIIAFAGTLAAVVFAWRLWLNLRADGMARIEWRRLLLVFLPLAVLALAGGVLLITAILYAALGLWIVTTGQAGFPVGDLPELERVLCAAMIGGLSFAGVAVGGAMMWPFVRLVRRNRTTT